VDFSKFRESDLQLDFAGMKQETIVNRGAAPSLTRLHALSSFTDLCTMVTSRTGLKDLVVSAFINKHNCAAEAARRAAGKTPSKL
jgi:hypothetical protein